METGFEGEVEVAMEGMEGGRDMSRVSVLKTGREGTWTWTEVPVSKDWKWAVLLDVETVVLFTMNPSRETPTVDACDIELSIDFGGNIQAEGMLHERPIMSVGSESIVDAIEEFAE